LSVTIEVIGHERSPLLIADGALKRGDALLEAAKDAAYSAEGSPHYPGLRAPAPEAYAIGLAAALRGPLNEAFGWDPSSVFAPLASSFSLVTTPPAELKTFQCLPHFDGTDPDIIAVLHYLCGEEKGGTSFYRHRSTGFETITEERHARYEAALRADLSLHGTPKGRYVTGSDAVFERVATVKAAWGRLVAYSGTVLHSGQIPEDFAFSADPEEGRLTVNTFLRRIA
jgi:hypothetical protein